MATVTYPVGQGAFVPGSPGPEFVTINGTNFPIGNCWAFDASTDEYIFSEGLFIPNYGSGNVSVLLDFYSRTGQTSGNVVWGAALSVRTPGDAQSVETDAFATENTVTQAVNGTARGPTRATVAVSNLDSLAANDELVLRIRRLASNGSDTMTGDALLRLVTLQYSDT
jgi:hypothetical protein